MKQKIALMLVFCMMITLFTISASTAYAEDWTLPEGTRMYKPGRTMMLDFGTMTILDAGFAKQSQSIIQISYRTVNGVTEENSRSVGYRTAKAGHALFAFKALLFNSSEQAVVLEDLNPTIRFSAEEPTTMYGYPAVPFGIPECFILEPGEDVEIVFACTAPNAMYYGSGDILLELAGGSMGFERADLGNYKSIGFTAQDGKATADDLTEASEKQENDSFVAKQTHADEVRIEDVSLVYDDTFDRYNLRVKVRNLYPHEKDQIGPDGIVVNFQFLDEAGDVLPADHSSIGGSIDLESGQAGWFPTSGVFTISKESVEPAVSLKFSSYQLRFSEVVEGTSKNISGKITESALFKLSDLLPDKNAVNQDAHPSNPILPEAETVPESETDNAPAYDPLEIENVFLRKSSSGWKIGFKVRNTGEKGHEIIQLNLQVLDAAGDVLSNVDTNVYNLEAGQAGKTEYKRIGCEVEEVASVRVFGYSYGTGTDIITHFNSEDRYKLITPIIVSIDDIVME